MQLIDAHAVSLATLLRDRAVLLGIAQGGSFSLALTFIVLRSRDSPVAVQLSGAGVGYLIADCGPMLVGLLRGWSGSFDASAFLFGAIGLAMLGALRAGRNRYVPAVTVARSSAGLHSVSADRTLTTPSWSIFGRRPQSARGYAGGTTLYCDKVMSRSYAARFSTSSNVARAVRRASAVSPSKNFRSACPARDLGSC
jgi:hypothetical protein